MPKISKKEEFRKMLIESLLKDAKKKKVTECTNSCKPKKSVTKKVTKKSVAKKSVTKKKMVGGDNFVKDLQRAGKGVGLSIEHTFQSLSNLSKDLYCETDAIMNIGRELDLGYTKDCPFTKTKSWDYNKIRQ